MQAPEITSQKVSDVVVVFSEEDASDVHCHNDDSMVINVKYEEWEIKRVLVNRESSSDILYCDAFERLHLDPKDLKPFQGSLVGFSGGHVQMKGYLTLSGDKGDPPASSPPQNE